MASPAPDRVVEALRNADGRPGGVLLLPHVGADGDALGSCFGFAIALRRAGYDVRVLLEEPVPPAFAFLPGAAEAEVQAAGNGDGTASEGACAPAVAVAVDCEGGPRLGARAARFAEAPVRLVVDHHPPAPAAEADPDGTIRFVDVSASCAGELVLACVRRLGDALGTDLLDRDAATCLLEALLYDTGGFRYSNTNAASFAAASLLAGYGASVRDLSYRLFEETSAGRLRLLGRAYTQVRLDCGGRIASVAVPLAWLAETAAVEGDLDGLAGTLRNVAGVEASFVLRENPRGGIRVNIRSGAAFDASAFARGFGGGGHARAAGFTAESGALEDVRDAVVAEASRLMACGEAR